MIGLRDGRGGHQDEDEPSCGEVNESQPDDELRVEIYSDGHDEVKIM